MRSTLVLRFISTRALSAHLEALRYVLMRYKICKIVGLSSDGLNVDDMKIWPNILGFVVLEGIQRLCDL